MDKIRIEGLDKTHVEGRADYGVREVNLTIRQNEFVALVGPSGCKSTLLKLTSALIRPSRGVLLFDGAALAHPPRDVGIVFQEAELLLWRTALDNVLLPAESLRLDKAKARACDVPHRFRRPVRVRGALSARAVGACSSVSRSPARSFTTPRSC
jgi:NitT/TauT family transport system ATP-binding protein